VTLRSYYAIDVKYCASVRQSDLIVRKMGDTLRDWLLRKKRVLERARATHCLQSGFTNPIFGVFFAVFTPTCSEPKI